MSPDLLRFAKAIGEPTRLRILNHLKHECCVGDLWKRLRLPQNLTSHHLRVLKTAKLLSAERRGTKVVYRLNATAIARFTRLLAAYIGSHR